MRTLAELGMKCDDPDQMIREGAKIWIDLTALLYPYSGKLIKKLTETAGKKRAELLISSSLEQDLQILKDECCGSLFPDKRWKASDEAWKIIGTASDVIRKNGFTCADGEKTSERGSDDVWVTGNSTQAQWMILKREAGSILLLTENGSFWLDAQNYSEWSGTLEKIRSSQPFSGMIPEEPDFVSEKGKRLDCFVSSLDRKNNNQIYEVQDQEILIKCAQDQEKLDWMLCNQPQLDCFAWPKEKVYFVKGKRRFLFGPEKVLFGYSMKKRRLGYRINEIFSLKRGYAIRIELALRLLKNALFLHMQGILISDYNFENFRLDQDGNLLMLDCMEYSVHDMVSRFEAPPVQRLERTPDYSVKSGYIQAEYDYLKATIACILSNGIWPYTADGVLCDKWSCEDAGITTDIRNEDGFGDAKEILDLDEPMQLLSYLGKIYERENRQERRKSRLAGLTLADFQPAPSVRHRTILLMIENSSQSEAFRPQIRDCVKRLLQTMRREYGLTAHYTDILVVKFSDTVRDTGLGTEAEYFAPLDELIDDRRFHEEFYLGAQMREAQYGEALGWACDIMRKRKETADSMVPVCILLGTFKSGISDKEMGKRPESLEEINNAVGIGSRILVKVKFGDSDGTLLNELEGDRIFYTGPESIRGILDCLTDQSSIITYRSWE